MTQNYRRYANIVAAFLLVLFVQGLASAQEKKEIVLKGKLLDEISNEPLIGATVAIKGTKTATQGDADGLFELATTLEPPFTLVVSYVGYQTKEIEIYEEDQEIEIKVRTNRALSEVVVVGYGEQKRSDVTGSVSSLPTELKTQPVASVERLLQGAVAGVLVTQTSGQPGGGVSVQIRGNNSITAGSDPLYVIDGFPVYNDYSVNNAGVTDGPKLNPLSSINTADIESIDVLKDASATAIYGSRGANGVIIVTTKKGSRDKSTITYDAYYGVQSVIRTIPLLNGAQWWDLRKDAAANSGKLATLVTNNKNLVAAAAAGGYTLDTAGAGTDWQGAAFTTAPITSHTISLLTGSEKTKIAFSGNYFLQDGVLHNTDFKRYTSRLNIEHDFNSRLKLNSYINASATYANVAPASIVTNLLQTPPVLPIYKNDGTFLTSSPFESALASPINSLYNQINQTNTYRFLGNASLEYQIIKGLTAKVLIGSDVTFNKQNRYLPISTYEGLSLSGDAYVGSIATTNWLNENTLNYTRNFGKKHRLNAVGGFSAQQAYTEGSTAEVAGFASDFFTYNNLGNGTNLRASASYANGWQLASFFGRVNYGYNDKYLFTFTLRADGSSKFGPNNKWGYFPSAAIGWNLHKEDFLKDVKAISNLKARFSAGLTGNQSIPSYSSLAQLAYFRYNFSGTNVSGYAPNTAANPNLSWETTAQYDFGIDLGLFNDRISIVSDVYYKKTTDLLLSTAVSGTSGLSDFYNGQNSYVFQNIGAVSNKGFELFVNSQNIVGKGLNWNTIFVYSVNKNEILDLGGLSQIIPSNTTTTPSVLKVGAPVGSFLVYQTDGLISASEAGTTALTPASNKSEGGQKYKDINGDGVITQADRIVVTNQPGYTLGLTNTFNYKGFDLTVFFQANVGSKLYNANRASLELGTGYINGSADLLNRYTANNTNTDVKEAYQDPAIVPSDRFVEDASYLRLKNVSLGYTLPSSWVSKVKLKNVRLYVSLQNFATWTSYTGYDPEVSLNGQTLINKGIDQGVYPNSKSVQGGLSVTF